MKKFFILFAAAVAALVSCGKEMIEPKNGEGEETPITFEFSANHPDMTKAVKGGWEAGDAIFVFFDNVAVPKHLKMSYDGSAWSSTEYYGATATPGALGLNNGDSGNMRAVFLPFGSDATVSASGTSFRFSKTYYTYYMTATLAYTVTDNKVSGAFNMIIPDGYVQFWVEDAAAEDELYNLSTDAVIPRGLASVASDGSVVETTNMSAGDAMLGYTYSGGYLFSGKLNTSYSGTGYYFIKDNRYDNERRDYLVTGKTLTSHSAVNLPANGSSKWLQVGPTKYVELKTGSNFSLGTWCTCNYGASLPEQIGTTLTFNGAVAQHAASQYMFQDLKDNCTWAWTSVKGRSGMGVKAATGFLFLPAQDGTSGSYWTSTDVFDNEAYFLYFNKNGDRDCLPNYDRNVSFVVRSVQ